MLRFCIIGKRFFSFYFCVGVWVALVEIWGPVEVVIVTQPCNRYDALFGG